MKVPLLGSTRVGTKLILMVLALMATTLATSFLTYSHYEKVLMEEMGNQTETLSKFFEIGVQHLTSTGQSDQQFLEDYVSRLKAKGVTEISILSSERTVVASFEPVEGRQEGPAAARGEDAAAAAPDQRLDRRRRGPEQEDLRHSRDPDHRRRQEGRLPAAQDRARRRRGPPPDHLVPPRLRDLRRFPAGRGRSGRLLPEDLGTARAARRRGRPDRLGGPRDPGSGRRRRGRDLAGAAELQRHDAEAPREATPRDPAAARRAGRLDRPPRLGGGARDPEPAQLHQPERRPPAGRPPPGRRGRGEGVRREHLAGEGRAAAGQRPRHRLPELRTPAAPPARPLPGRRAAGRRRPLRLPPGHRPGGPPRSSRWNRGCRRSPPTRRRSAPASSTS